MSRFSLRRAAVETADAAPPPAPDEPPASVPAPQIAVEPEHRGASNALLDAKIRLHARMICLLYTSRCV